MTAGPTGNAGRRVLLFGASGTIGRATARALLADGHSVTCMLRDTGSGSAAREELERCGAECRVDADGTVPTVEEGRFDCVISCLASRSGEPDDAWAVDYAANAAILAAAKTAGIPHMVLLSAICVQKPGLAFQHAKLAFERELAESGLAWTIIRPTAFFKSLSGQVERVRRGKPFLLFGDGDLTRCKPISDDDLARFISSAVTDTTMHNRLIPIGGPGPAMTPREQGEMLFDLLGRQLRFRRVPVAMLDAIIAVLDALGRVSRRARAKAEYARIGRYYATESMLVLDPGTGTYRAEMTPETGSQTLADLYARLLGR